VEQGGAPVVLPHHPKLARPTTVQPRSDRKLDRPHRHRLKVACQLDTNPYPTGVKTTDAQLKTVQLERSAFQGDWNYRIRLRNSS